MHQQCMAVRPRGCLAAGWARVHSIVDMTAVASSGVLVLAQSLPVGLSHILYASDAMISQHCVVVHVRVACGGTICALV